MSKFTADDERWLRRALQLAVKGQGQVEPNPMVGCVIVRRGRLIGPGYHRRFGGPHAEVEALRKCRESVRGATAYVTLEPCCHYGKTPPCTEALIAAGIGRVVAPGEDPNPGVSGGGFARLRAAGMRVDTGLLAEEAQRLNAPFFKLMRQGRPWVILKWAQSLDGKIATRTGDAKWISDETCRAHAHRVRGRLDAIVVGAGTVRTDDPMLTCRVGRPKRIATRVVLDSQLRISPRCQLVQSARQWPTWIFCGQQAPVRRAKNLERAGCVLLPVRQTRRGLSLPAVLDALGQRQMTNVLVEGGGLVLGSFFDEGLADEYHVYVAPVLIGGGQAPGPLAGKGAAHVAEAVRLRESGNLRRMGDGYVVQARVTS